MAGIIQLYCCNNTERTPLNDNHINMPLRHHVNAKIIGRFGDADDFLDCFIIPARIVGGTFWD